MIKNISLTKVDNEDLSGWNYSVDIETNNDTDVHLVFLFDTKKRLFAMEEVL